MEGDPALFEWRGSRIGYRTRERAGELTLDWRCPLFPPLLCLGIAVLLFFPSFFIAKAIWLNAGPGLALWYFPVMNLVLFAIGIDLLSLRRKVIFLASQKTVRFTKTSLYGVKSLRIDFDEIARAQVAPDFVRIGFMMVGRGERQGHPIPAVRLILSGGQMILVERGRKERVVELGQKISRTIGCPLAIVEEPNTGDGRDHSESTPSLSPPLLRGRLSGGSGLPLSEE